MTQRYAHLRDETLRRASNLAEGIIAEAMKPKKKKRGKVVTMKNVRQKSQTLDSGQS
jgi:hypothetical protein